MIKDYIVLLLVACFCVCEQYDDDDYSETENKVDSGSREVFNTSSRRRPGRFIELLNDNRLKDNEDRVRTSKSTRRTDLEPIDLEPTVLEQTELDTIVLEPTDLELKDQEPTDLEQKVLKITEFPWTTESKTEEPTWSIEATEKPFWRIDSVERKSANLNDGTQVNEEWPMRELTIEPDPSEPTEEITEVTEEPVEVTETPVEFTEEPLELTEEPLELTEEPLEVTEQPVEVTEEQPEVTEEPVEVTDETTPFSPFNGERLKNSDDSNEEYKTTTVTYINEESHTQVTHAKEHKAPLANYPFAVSIQRMGAHYSSGALVDKKWILSSAGEFYNVRESIKLYRARLGSVDCKRGGKVVPLRTIEIHPSFVPGKPNYDIAMIRMAVLVDFTDHIHPIGLTKVQDKVLSAKFLTTYWPRVVIKGQVLPSTAKEREKYNSMRVSTQRLIPWNKCYDRLIQQKESLAESSLCLRPVHAHHSNCMPDAGAPVVANDGLWGITSGWTSQDCATARRPSPVVVARVSSPSVRSWLDSLLLAPEN